MIGDGFVFVVGALSHYEVLWEISDYSFKLFLSKLPEEKRNISFMYVK